MDLQQRLERHNVLLAPFAVPHAIDGTREQQEESDSTRFAFQRDRDRIIHSTAFRRLGGKTQVFSYPHIDHVRTRLTHTSEVAQLSRDIARTLQLNEDLAEAIALAHDLGHPPFGHAGEEALNLCMQEHDLHFEHNQQSFRICTVLEQRKESAPGLNLTQEVRDGIRKHDGAFPVSLEAQVTDFADELAYTAHDAEDGVRAEVFTFDALQSVLPKSVQDAIADGARLRSAIIDWILTDVYQTTQRNIADANIHTLEDVRNATSRIVTPSASVRDDMKAIRTFLFANLYESPSVQESAKHGQEIISKLFAAYMQTPPPKVLDLQTRTQSSLPEAVKDYIAGMTDRFALQQSQTI